MVATYFSVNVLLSSHVIIGRLRRSLYVGKSMEYLFLFASGAMVKVLYCELGERATGVERCDCSKLRDDRRGDRVRIAVQREGGP